MKKEWQIKTSSFPAYNEVKDQAILLMNVNIIKIVTPGFHVPVGRPQLRLYNVLAKTHQTRII